MFPMKKPTLLARKHFGGTLTGFVVGLLVGLGIALSVAVYVTRVPVPFVDRGVSRKPAQDVEEAERNKGWNPNAGLAGNPATVPAPAVSPEATVPVVADPAGSPAAADPVGKPVAQQPPAPPADPLGDLMRARTGAVNVAAPAAGAAVTSDPFTYFVQAGAFRAPEEAEAQRARLAMLGMAADISEREQSGRAVFRVRVGPFSQKAMADATLEQLEINGVDAALVRVQR